MTLRVNSEELQQISRTLHAAAGIIASRTPHMPTPDVFGPHVLASAVVAFNNEMARRTEALQSSWMSLSHAVQASKAAFEATESTIHRGLSKHAEPL